MQKTAGLIKKRALELLADGTVTKVLGWEEGDFIYDVTPAFFDKETIDSLVFSSFCGSNLSKYLIKACKEQTEGKILVFLKPCDTFSFNQLLTEHRIDREKVYVVGVECKGMLDIEKIKALGINGVTKVIDNGESLNIKTIYGEKTCERSEVLLEKCTTCKSKELVVFDEVLGEKAENENSQDRFAQVAALEAMTTEERYAFWQGELSKCIRCNACRNVCPACSCMKCVFDNIQSGVASKSNADTFEEKMFHIIRAFHVAGRCTDCGECSRVCPQGIPLHLLNRKFIKDINELYGDYQAGEEAGSRAPLVNFTFDDAEPSVIHERGNS
ncbi:MAG: 4Fe-4S dicluster domain-containing protein [Clostridia bacterium]|nr:4Fe-4S dicluster domain-containing protein [Clostridia bacterium]